MNEQHIRKAPPPPSFGRKTPPPPPIPKKIEVETNSTTNNLQNEVIIQSVPNEIPKIKAEEAQPQVIKNEDVKISTFSKETEIQLFEVFGQEVMSSFITDKDRIGAVYVIMQSLINSYTNKHKEKDFKHSLSPVEMDDGITNQIIQFIVIDLGSYYYYFSNNTAFNRNKVNYNLVEPKPEIFDNNENIIKYMLALFKTISSLDNTNIINDEKVLAPYESDMIKVNKLNNQKMWELAEQVKESIVERNAIIDEIAVPIIKKGYPVDARKLAANFLKESKSHPELAIKALYENPATFAPILTEKLPRKMFGLIGPSVQDAIDINKSLGRFLKKFVN